VAEGSVFKTALAQDFSETLYVYSTGNAYPTLFRAGKGEGRQEEEWHPSSVIPLPSSHSPAIG